MLEAFHFLRPWWLLGIVAAVALFAVLQYRTSVRRRWKGVIDEHLLDHLMTGTEARLRFKPSHLIALAAVLGSVAAAGPTWDRELSPFAEDAAPLVIALDMSATMDAVDVQPSRLERAKQKTRDLLATRQGARTALIVYSGSAHTVLPLSDDASIFDSFLAALETGLMPVPGKDAGSALALATDLLEADSVAGTILFITDGIASDRAPLFTAHQDQSQDQVIVLAVGTLDGGPVRTADGSFARAPDGRRIMATLDRDGLEALRKQAGVFVTSSTVDQRDVDEIQRRVRSHLRSVQQEDPSTRWRDRGYYLVFPVALLALFWFRKGWTVRWGVFLLLIAIQGCKPGGQFEDLWWTPDQRAQRLLEAGEVAAAAEEFQDPFWKGVAAYRAGDFELASAQFAVLDSPEASYNLGNAFANLALYDDAVAAYDSALAARPDWSEAQENRDRVAALLESPEEPESPPQGQADPTFDPDEIKIDNKADDGEEGEVNVQKLSDEQIADMWMRRLQTSPADFLRWRFASEAARDMTQQ